MGGKDSIEYANFVETCCKAYNFIRKNSAMFLTMFSLMVSTGMPELQSVKDIGLLCFIMFYYYFINIYKEPFRKCLCLDKTDEEAAIHFRSLIAQSLSSFGTRLNHGLHILVHDLRN